MREHRVCHWDLPSEPLAQGVFCGTTLCPPADGTAFGVPDGADYGAFNLAQHVGDDPAAVNANREALQEMLEVVSMQWLDQVHGIQVVEASRETVSRVPTADAVWTATPQLAIAVLTADCLPVVLAARDGSCVGVAHGGWRGLVAGVLPALVAAMPSPASELVAWGGPGIGVKRYEVGEDVARAVGELAQSSDCLLAGAKRGKYQLDLHALAAMTLAQVGVTQYRATDRCAYDDAGCYSYRRHQGQATGRMATVGLLRAQAVF